MQKVSQTAVEMRREFDPPCGAGVQYDKAVIGNGCSNPNKRFITMSFSLCRDGAAAVRRPYVPDQ